MWVVFDGTWCPGIHEQRQKNGIYTVKAPLKFYIVIFGGVKLEIQRALTAVGGEVPGDETGEVSGEVSGWVVYSPPEPPAPRALSCSVNTWVSTIQYGSEWVRKKKEIEKNEKEEKYQEIGEDVERRTRTHLSCNLLDEGCSPHYSLPVISVMISWHICILHICILHICSEHMMKW